MKRRFLCVVCDLSAPEVSLNPAEREESAKRARNFFEQGAQQGPPMERLSAGLSLSAPLRKTGRQVAVWEVRRVCSWAVVRQFQGAWGRV